MLVAFTQFFANSAHLLTQVVVTLFLINMGSGLFLNIGFQLQHLHLLTQHLNSIFQATNRIQLAQKLCLLRIINTGILGNCVGDEAAVFRCQHAQLNRLGRALCKFQIIAVKRIGITAHGPGTQGFCNLNLAYTLNTAAQIGFSVMHLCNFTAVKAGNQNPDVIPLRLQNLLDLCYAANRVQSGQMRIIFINALLGCQKKNLIFLHGGIQRQRRFHTAHIKMNRLFRKYCHAPKSQDRHFPHNNNFAHGILLSLYSRKKGVVTYPLP